MDKSHFDIRVIGKVQGVFYRASTMTKAMELSIFGFVRNEIDGSVYIEAEGSSQKLDKFIQWCNEGSDFSRVDNIDVQEANVKNFTTFEIKRN